MMKRSILTCAVKKTNGVVTQIGRGYIMQSVANCKGGAVKWYPDKLIITRSGLPGMVLPTSEQDAVTKKRMGE